MLRGTNFKVLSIEKLVYLPRNSNVPKSNNLRTIKNGFRTLVRTRADVNCQDVEGKTALQERNNEDGVRIF